MARRTAAKKCMKTQARGAAEAGRSRRQEDADASCVVYLLKKLPIIDDEFLPALVAVLPSLVIYLKHVLVDSCQTLIFLSQRRKFHQK